MEYNTAVKGNELNVSIRIDLKNIFVCKESVAKWNHLLHIKQYYAFPV